MENHLIGSQEAFFFAPKILVPLTKSFDEINRESLLSKKLFGRVLAVFSRKLGLETLLNRPQT
jgi:hypothetical protein